MTVPKTMPDFPMSAWDAPRTCGYEDTLAEKEAMREYQDQFAKCQKMRNSRVYGGIMSLAGQYKGDLK